MNRPLDSFELSLNVTTDCQNFGSNEPFRDRLVTVIKPVSHTTYLNNFLLPFSLQINFGDLVLDLSSLNKRNAIENLNKKEFVNCHMEMLLMNGTTQVTPTQLPT